MSGIAEAVSLLVRSSIKADPVYTARLKTIQNITVHEHTHVTALQGDKFLTGITIQDDMGSEQLLILDGVFVEIGWLPNTDILDGFVEVNEKKEIVVDVNCRTSRPGVFAAGDITNEKSKQIIIASGDGAKAALEAYEYLMSEWKE